MKRWLVNTAVIFVTLAGIFLHTENGNGYVLSWIVIVISVMSVFRARKDWYMFTIYSFILYCNYSVHMVFYLQHHVISSGLARTYIGTQTASLGLNVFAFFTASMFIIIPPVKGRRQPIRSLNINNRDNPYLVIADILLMLGVLIFYHGSLNFKGIRGGGSAVGEYSTAFVILGAYFSGNRKYLKVALIFIAVLYTLKDFLMGERVGGLQLIMIVIFTFYAEKLSLKKLLPPAILLLILMRLIGDQRGHFSLSLDIIVTVTERLLNGHLVFDTCYAAWHGSLTVLNCLEFSGWGQRLWLFGQFLMGLLYGSNSAEYIDYVNLTRYSNQFFPNMGGGFMATFAYFYLGVPGIILLCAWIRFLFRAMRNAYTTDNGLIRCMAIYVTCAVPRWYLYGLFNITRSLLLLSIGYCVFNYVDRTMKTIASKIHTSSLLQV